MGCVSSHKIQNGTTKSVQTQKSMPSMNQNQCRLLKLIYSDLAQRSPKKQVTIQNFLLFFHKNGYWGERLFKQFDTGKSNTITEKQFIRGMIKIFKTTQEKKIQLLYKFFSDNNLQVGITFTNFLTMLYNYPKEDLKKILNDQQFINNQIKGSLIGLDSEVKGRRLESLMPSEANNFAISGKAFRLEQSQSGAQRKQSRYGNKLIYQLSKRNSEKQTTLKITVGRTDVQIKTTSIHHLVKKYARSIFRHYQIDEKTGTLKFQNFKDWVINHKTLYNDYYSGFHCQTWQIDTTTNQPAFVRYNFQISSKGQFYQNNICRNVMISLLHSILIVCDQNNCAFPLMIICLQGLAANPIFDNQKGYGFQITHRDGVYQPKKFFFLNQQLQREWMENLKYFKGASVNQLYDIKEKIGMGKFSIVYHCIQKATNEDYAIKVIESYKLDQQAKNLLAHESGIMSVMSHPLLAFYKQSITTKTHIYIVTQLVKGKDLFDFVRQLRHLQQPQVCYIIEQVIIGVSYIHSLGIVHRDLKPENIMLQYDENTSLIGRIKIIDFGFANYLSNMLHMPKQQLWAGTPNYIAPQILKLQSFSQKIDNFAIGSILYYLLSGSLPFNSVDTSLILTKTVEGAYSMSDQKWKNVSEQAKDLVSKFLQNDPKHRITLEQALQHKWLQAHRSKRLRQMSMKVNKSIIQQVKVSQNKPNKKTDNRSLIY